MRLLSKFLKRKSENRRVKNIHVEYVELTFNMQALREGGGRGGGEERVVNLD